MPSQTFSSPSGTITTEDALFRLDHNIREAAFANNLVLAVFSDL